MHHTERTKNVNLFQLIGISISNLRYALCIQYYYGVMAVIHMSYADWLYGYIYEYFYGNSMYNKFNNCM